MQKKIFSLIVALALCLGLASPALAASKSPKNPGAGAPLVIVQGFNSVPLMLDGKAVFLPSDPMDIVKAALSVVPGLATGIPKAVVSKSVDPVAKGLLPLGRALFGPLELDAGLKSVGPPLTAKQFPGSMATHADEEDGLILSLGGHYYADKYGWDHVYLFTYDWRRDVYDLAAELDSIVQRAKRETGYSCVNIAAMSMGAAVTNAWLSEYGAKNKFRDLGNLVYLSPGWQGASVISALLTGDMTLDMDNLRGQLLMAQGDKPVVPDWALETIFLPLKRMGLPGFVERLAVPLSDMYLRNVVKYWAGVWSLVPYEDYDRACEICFPGGGTKEEKALIKSLDKYHKAQGKIAALMKDVQKAGHGFAVISFYAAPLYAPIVKTEAHGLWADGVIDTYYTGGFPTLGKFPGGGLTAQKVKDGHHHLSPDGVVDASTCLFPENTWFVRGAYHADYPDRGWTSALVSWLLDGGSLGTVHSDKGHPQFTKFVKGSEEPGVF